MAMILTFPLMSRTSPYLMSLSSPSGVPVDLSAQVLGDDQLVLVLRVRRGALGLGEADELRGLPFRMSVTFLMISPRTGARRSRRPRSDSLAGMSSIQSLSTLTLISRVGGNDVPDLDDDPLAGADAIADGAVARLRVQPHADQRARLGRGGQPPGRDHDENKCCGDSLE